MTSGLLVSVAGVLAVAGAAAGQTDRLYITDGDSQRLAIVQGGVLQSVKTTHVRGYPIVVNSSLWIGDYNGNQPNAIEYDLDGNATGATVPYTPIFAVDAGSDGGQSFQLGNAFNSNATVYAGGAQFENSTPLFDVQGSDLVGITYDTANGSIWVSDQSQLYEYSLGGSLLSSFSHQSGRGCIAYEASSDSIWYVTNGSDTITQYAKNGKVLNTLQVGGLASNNWGAEFAARVPTPGAAALFGMAAVVGTRRRR